MPTRVITKALAVEEDLRLGKGLIQQDRGGVTLDLHQISVSKVVSDVGILGNDATFDEHVDPNLYTTILVESYSTLGDEGGGIFYWDPTVNPLAADTGHIFASGVAPLLGAWVRLTDDKVINVKHFGATGDGVTDDTATVQAAVAAANTRIKATLYFPEGTYQMDTPIDVTAMDAVAITGDGQQNTILNYTGAAGPLFRVDTGGEVDELAQFAIIKDMTLRTNRTDLTCIYHTSSEILGDITRSAYYVRLTFIGETAADGWNFCVHSQDVRGITLKDCYGRHVAASVGTIFWNIDNTIAFPSDDYTSFNNECWYYENKFGALTPTGGVGTAPSGPIDGADIIDDTITIDKLADGTPGDIITWDAAGEAILLPIGAVGFVLTSQGPGLPPIWAAIPGVTPFDICTLAAGAADDTADEIAICDTSDSNTMKKITLAQLFTFIESSITVVPPTTQGAVGTYIMARLISGAPASPGGTVAGSELTALIFDNIGGDLQSIDGVFAESGTWRNMSQQTITASSTRGGLFVRTA